VQGVGVSSMNDDGIIVGVAITASGDYRAWIYPALDGTNNLNVLIDPYSGWNLQVATDINEAGHIVGYGTRAGDKRNVRAFALAPPGVNLGPSRLQTYNHFAVLNTVLGGVTVDGGGPTSRGPVPPWGPVESQNVSAVIGASARPGAARITSRISENKRSRRSKPAKKS
jgi:hypothetical protein